MADPTVRLQNGGTPVPSVEYPEDVAIREYNRRIVASAEQLERVLAAAGWLWTRPDRERHFPSAADIALRLRDAIDGLEPGEAVSFEQVLVERSTEGVDGGRSVQIYVNVGPLYLWPPTTPLIDQDALRAACTTE